MEKFMTNNKMLATTLLAGGINYEDIKKGSNKEFIFIYNANEALQIALENYYFDIPYISPQKVIDAYEKIQQMESLDRLGINDF